MGTWLTGQEGGREGGRVCLGSQTWEDGRARAAFSPPCAVITVTAQTSRLREQLSHTALYRFAYAAIIIVIYNNYSCIVSALKISIFL